MANRQWGKRVLLGLAGLVVIGAIAGWWLARDEQPNATHMAWAERLDSVDSPTDAYLWLMGFTAPADDDPLAAGQRFMNDAMEWLANADEELPFIAVGYSVSPDWLDNSLPLPRNDKMRELLQCQGLELPPCDQLTSVLDEHALVLERLRAWPLRGEGLQSSPELATLIPAFQGIVSASQLDLLDQLRLLLTDQPEEALSRMAEHDRQLRQALAETRNLVGAMVMVAVIDEAVNTRVRWVAEGWLPASVVTEWLADIDRVDQLLFNMILGEFSFVRAFDRDALDASGGDLSRWYARLAFKAFFRPVAIMNHTALLYQSMAELDTPIALSEFVRGERVMPESPRRWDPLHMIPAPEPFLEYIARVHDLNAKMTLARTWLAVRPETAGQLTTLAEANPYGEGYGIEWNDEARLCFSGPLEDRRSIRCLPASLTEHIDERITP